MFARVGSSLHASACCFVRSLGRLHSFVRQLLGHQRAGSFLLRLSHLAFSSSGHDFKLNLQIVRCKVCAGDAGLAGKETGDAPHILVCVVVRFGGCVFLGILYSLDLSFSQFDQCAGPCGTLCALRGWLVPCGGRADVLSVSVFVSGFWGGSLYIWSPSYHGPLGFAQLPYYLTGLVMGNGFVRGSDLINENSRGGAILLVDIRVVVSFEELAISNTSSMDRGGAISISSCSPEVLFSLAHFSGLVATTHGGAISVESTPFLTLMDCAFNNVVATSRGGFEHSYTRNSGHAIAAAGGHCSCHVIARLALCLCACAGAVSSSSSIVTLSSCTFEDVFLRAAQGEPDASKVSERLSLSCLFG